MTQAEAKASIDRAFEESLGRIFGILVSNLKLQSPAEATQEFHAGFENHLRAHAIATAIAEQLIRG